MTTSAWITLSVTWVIIIFYTFHFFIKVVRTPQEKKHSVKDA